MLSIVKRKSTYYIRMRVPVDLRKHIPCRELVRSLHTGLYRQAKSLARVKIGVIESTFTLLRSNVLTPAMIQAVVSNLFSSEVVPVPYIPLPRNVSVESIELFKKENPGKSWIVGVNPIDGSNIYDPEVVSYDDLMIASGANTTEAVPPQQMQTMAEAVAPKGKEKRHTLKLALTSFIASKRESKKAIKARGLSRYDEIGRAIIESLIFETGESDVPLTDIDYELTKKLILRLQKYPSRRSDYRGKKLDEVYKMDGIKFPKPSTANKAISTLGYIYEHAIAAFKGLERNYVADLTDLKEPEGKASEARDIFQNTDVAEIVRELVKRKIAGEFLHSPHLPLITLIGLFQGMRANEICQLAVDDIIKVEELWCFKITEELPEQSVKTNNSKRRNPIHPKLLELGLIEFWELQKRKGCKRLWEFEGDMLTKTEKSRRGLKGMHSCAFYAVAGSHSHYYTRWFNTTLKNNIKLSNPSKQSFHSTRHTFCNWFWQNLNMRDHGEAVGALMGHLDKDDVALAKQQGFDPTAITFTRYVSGEGLSVKRQYETLEQLDYRIDLTPLMP